MNSPQIAANRADPYTDPLGALRAHLSCPLTLELMRDPVMASDGFMYERGAIVAWLGVGSDHRSPMTGVPLPNFALLPAHQTRALTATLLAAKEDPAAPPLPPAALGDSTLLSATRVPARLRSPSGNRHLDVDFGSTITMSLWSPNEAFVAVVAAKTVYLLASNQGAAPLYMHRHCQAGNHADRFELSWSPWGDMLAIGTDMTPFRATRIVTDLCVLDIESLQLHLEGTISTRACLGPIDWSPGALQNLMAGSDRI